MGNRFGACAGTGAGRGLVRVRSLYAAGMGAQPGMIALPIGWGLDAGILPATMPRGGTGPNSFALRVLALGAAGYVAAVAAASSRPDPIRWGLHLPAFLDPVSRAALLATAAVGVVLLGIAAWGAPARKPSREKARPAPWFLPLLLVFYGIVLYALRCRTHLLGDGIVWLNALQSEEGRPYSEPLAAALWKGFVAASGTLGLPADPRTYAVLPVLCGVASAALAWGIVQEAADGRATRGVAWGLILTAGFTQLYFGYIESYPIVSTAFLAVIWLTFRHARGADRPWLLGTAVSTAIGIHLVALTLVPAYATAVIQRPGPRAKKAALLALPLLLAPALLVAAGTNPGNWVEPFRTATTGSATGAAGPHLARPYAALSLAHASDVTQGFLLAIPVAALALIAALAGRIRDRTPGTTLSPGAWVLAAAALPGLVLAASLMLPVAPAQDWDLTAVLLLPAGVAGCLVAARLTAGDARARAGVLMLSAAALLSFVLVNAGVRSSLGRFAVLLGPGARVSPYGLGYGNSVLSEYYEDEGDFAPALEYARRALQAEPTNARFWLRSGTLLYKLERYDEAQVELEESIRRGTVRSGAYYNLALCYVRKGRMEDAVARFRTAVAMDSDRPDYRHNLGLALYLAGETDSARVVWTEVLRRWPEYTITARAMARRFAPALPPR